MFSRVDDARSQGACGIFQSNVLSQQTFRSLRRKEGIEKKNKFIMTLQMDKLRLSSQVVQLTNVIKAWDAWYLCNAGIQEDSVNVVPECPGVSEPLVDKSGECEILEDNKSSSSLPSVPALVTEESLEKLPSSLLSVPAW